MAGDCTSVIQNREDRYFTPAFDNPICVGSEEDKKRVIVLLVSVFRTKLDGGQIYQVPTS